jgi:O-antigen/teichoic acid export membrane protein
VGLVVARRAGVPSFLGAALASIVASCIWAWKRLRTRFVGGAAASLPLFRRSVRYAAKAYFAALFAFLVLRADLFMVQHMLGPQQAGYYSIAASMADYVSILSVVVGTILFPRLSAMTELKAKLQLTRQAVWGTVGLLLPMLAVASLLAKPAVSILFGSAFLPSAFAFILLMPGMFFLGINTVAVQFLNSIGYPSSVVVIWALCAFLNIGLNFWVIPRRGILGASVVSSISYFLAFFLILLVIRRAGAQQAKN